MMSMTMSDEQAEGGRPRTSFLDALGVQCRVIGALLMRELHTRYGRDNIGYLWLIAEPLMFGTVIAALHSGGQSHEGINPVAFEITGYSIFIMFRGIANRSLGALESNTPLLYHRMVTVLDITIARALLELAGTVSAFLVLMSIAILLGFASLPARPLYLMLGIVFLFWLSFALSMMMTGGTYERPLLDRLLHPMTYFAMPISGAFIAASWIPEPYRDIILFLPLAPIFELVRYGQFESAGYEYVSIPHTLTWCSILTLLGMRAVASVNKRIQLR